MKMKGFRFKFHWSLSFRSNWQQPSIRFDNGLAPNRRQAIIWTNADPIHYAALGEDELTGLCRFELEYLSTSPDVFLTNRNSSECVYIWVNKHAMIWLNRVCILDWFWHIMAWLRLYLSHQWLHAQGKCRLFPYLYAPFDRLNLFRSSNSNSNTTCFIAIITICPQTWNQC